MSETDEEAQRAMAYKMWEDELVFLFQRLEAKFATGSTITLIVHNDALSGADRDFCWTTEPNIEKVKEAVARVAARKEEQEKREVGQIVKPHLNGFALKVEKEKE